MGSAMKLKIQNYNILNFENQNILISETGVTKVNSPSLLKIITTLKGRASISDHELYDLFHQHNLDKGDAYLSLEAMLGLHHEPQDIYFDKTTIIHDWKDHDQLTSLIKTELTNITVTASVPELDQECRKETKQITILLCENYNYEKIKKTYFKHAEDHPDDAIIVGYTAGDQFIISQPYLPALGSPCHFCTVDRLIENEKYRPSNNTWSNFLNFCHAKRTSIPAPSLSIFQKTLIIGALIQKIKLLTGQGESVRYQDNILQQTSVSLVNGQLSESTTSHWCLCSCLRNIK
jgi:McbB family protein